MVAERPQGQMGLAGSDLAAAVQPADQGFATGGASGAEEATGTGWGTA